MSTRIMMLITGLTLGGAETQALRIMTGLARRGYRLRVVSMLPPRAYTDEFAAAGIDVLRLDMTRGKPRPYDLIRARNLIAAWRPHTLLNFMHHAILLGRLAGRWAGCDRIVSSIRNMHLGGQTRRWALKATRSLDTMTTTNSRLAAEDFVARGIVSPKRMVYIPNGIDLSEYGSQARRAEIRNELGVKDGEFLWLSVGRLETQKNHAALIDAFATLPVERHILAIVGIGPLRADLERRALGHGVAGRVRWLEWRRDVPDLMVASDALVSSSLWEGTPNVVIEAQASGRPVVATDVGGVREVVTHRIGGLIIPPNDVPALSLAMRELAGIDPTERLGMGLAGRNALESRYGLERVLDAWEQILTEDKT